ncbi:MAG TPA: family 1 encapsulin nanocompartment shell protein [Usitatibacter sp.]|nr:family 1 encapsulin nanocompartment shell protein [Usitatibacter sp.]
MNHLLRELAPIPAAAWEQIDDEARRTLTAMLAARKLVEFEGPLGWQASAVNLGRTSSIKAPREGAQARLREVLPLVELRVPFAMPRDEIDAIARGAKDANLDPVREAARSAALAEDHAVFHGFPDARIDGIVEAAAQGRCSITQDYQAYLAVVAEALQKLRDRGIGGPYAIALGPRCYTGLGKTLLGGFPVLEQLRQLVDGPIVSAPAVNGAVVLSTRGGDFELTVGQDFSIGYVDHDAKSVRLCLVESMTFRVLTTEAAVPLAYAS